MREDVPLDPVVDAPFAEELVEEARTWAEPPSPPVKPVRPETAVDTPRAIRYDLD